MNKIIDLYKTVNFLNFVGDNEEAKTLYNFTEILCNDKNIVNHHPVFEHLKSLFSNNIISLSQNSFLYRARKINYSDFSEFLNDDYYGENEDDFHGFNAKDSFVPPIHKLPDNRASQKNTPCLYAACEEKTAIAEVRPYVGNEISIATININRDLKLFDLYVDISHDYNTYLLDSHLSLWLSLALEFSIPHEEKSNKEYLLSQCISNYIKNNSDFDGIQYLSTLNEGGKNIVLFNCKNIDDGGDYDVCKPLKSRICFINSIDCNYDYNYL